MIQNLVYNLCESFVENVGGMLGVGKKSTPITYLTQWKIIGNSEVHTLPYPDGVVLPTGYKRCKYLEFHKAEYIDSGIIPEQGIGIDMQFSYSDTGESELIGVRTAAWSADSFYAFHQVSGKMFVSYGGQVCSIDAASPVINKDEIVTITLDSQKYKSVINGSTFEKDVETAIVKGTAPLFIGDVAGYGSSRFSGKLYYVTISLNGVDIFNGIPCLDDNNVPCLYDTISGTSFYNDGTGTFGYEIEPQSTEIWSCGEYNPIDGKYHILVQPLGGNIADIVLDAPLRKVNDVADTIEFPSDTEGKALVTRKNCLLLITSYDSIYCSSYSNAIICGFSDQHLKNNTKVSESVNIIIEGFNNTSYSNIRINHPSYSAAWYNRALTLYDSSFINNGTITQAFYNYIKNKHFLIELTAPTTELVDAPQIEEAESYSMVISQGGKAVSWSSFETE